MNLFSTSVNMKKIYYSLNVVQQESARRTMQEYAAAAAMGLLTRSSIWERPHKLASRAWDFAEALYVEENKRFENKD